MKTVLVTGGSGFFGGLLKRRLLAEGFQVVNLDLIADLDLHPALQSHQGDIRNLELLRQLFLDYSFDAVFHCAAMLAHDTVSAADLWSSNVDGTRNVGEACSQAGVLKLIFVSSNCLWGANPGHEVAEDETPRPIELYGRSKLAGEQALAEFRHLHTIILRCPTIVDSGRLGLLAILFEFIQEGRRVWVVGDGSNRYQFIYAQDLATACLLALDHSSADLFHIGSENVASLRQVYEAVISAAGTHSRVAELPKRLTIATMRLAHTLRVSPLGPYHYRMIAQDFIFDTRRIRRHLGWAPTLTNEQMMVQAYLYYAANKSEIEARLNVSAHSKPAQMGVIRLLKWLS